MTWPRSQFQAVQGAAAAGDYTSASKLQGFSDTFLAASRAVNGSGAGYANDFGQVLGALEAVSGAPVDALTNSAMLAGQREQTAALSVKFDELRARIGRGAARAGAADAGAGGMSGALSTRAQFVVAEVEVYQPGTPPQPFALGLELGTVECPDRAARHRRQRRDGPRVRRWLPHPPGGRRWTAGSTRRCSTRRSRWTAPWGWRPGAASTATFGAIRLNNLGQRFDGFVQGRNSDSPPGAAAAGREAVGRGPRHRTGPALCQPRAPVRRHSAQLAGQRGAGRDTAAGRDLLGGPDAAGHDLPRHGAGWAARPTCWAARFP